MPLASVSRFVEEIRSLYKAEGEAASVWPKARVPMTTLLADPALAAGAGNWPVCGHENLLFYEDPDYGFVLNGLVKAPRQETRVHDHAHVWVLYGVLTGSEEIVNYARTDDGKVADRATLKEVDRAGVKPGVIQIVKPWAVHMEAAGDQGSVAMILRSHRPGGFLQGRYEPDGRYWQGKGVAQIPYTL
jgi:predicted metal-dependent enzyme (double-stranded beta helix superfamily)